jgi:hypothetical protein
LRSAARRVHEVIGARLTRPSIVVSRVTPSPY